MSKDNGGPAFPRPASEAHQHGMHGPQDGMTLRDWFAGKECSSPPLTWWQARVGSHIESVFDLHGVEYAEGLSAWRYQCAEAMLAERAK